MNESITWWERTKIFMYHLVLVGMWANFSLPSLFSNNPVNFQAAGSIVVAYAIFNLSRTRANYDTVQRKWIIKRFEAQIRRLDLNRSIADDRINNTVDMHVFHLKQLCEKQGIHHIWEISAKEMGETAERINLGLAKERPYKELEKVLEEVNEVEDSYHKFENEMKPWMTVVWRLEVGVLILGTLQWGYGDRLVRLIYDHGWLV